MSKSLTQFIVEEQKRVPSAGGDLVGLLDNIVVACKQIASSINRGGLAGVLGSAGSENVQGETQKKLDVITNDIFIGANEWSGHLAAMASEEMDDVCPIPTQYQKGKYLLAFDPLVVQHRRKHLCGHHLLGFVLPRRCDQSNRKRFFAARCQAGLCWLRVVWALNNDGAHHWTRCKWLYLRW